jgi:vacuolar-type H+-ATPase subunit H
MSTPQSIVEAQTEALLRRLAREQESRCRRTLDAAREQARSIVARAWEEARLRLRQAVDEERRDVDKALADRRASLETVRRRAEQSVLRELMDAAWSDLPQTLVAAWGQPERRQEWCSAACRLAARTMPNGAGFIIELDASEPEETARMASAGLLAGGSAAVETRRVASLGAGLRIRSGRACVDATVPGLLASRERVESELLAELERLAERVGSE